MLHEMSLLPEPFERMRAGVKTIEVRLNDPKRQRVRPQDEIRFYRLPDRSETLLVLVTERMEHPSFAALYGVAEPESFGGESAEQLLEQTYSIYTPEREAQYGALGLRVRLLATP